MGGARDRGREATFHPDRRRMDFVFARQKDAERGDACADMYVRRLLRTTLRAHVFETDTRKD